MAENRKSGVKRILILLGLFAACVLGAYSYGRWQGVEVAQGVRSQAAGDQAQYDGRAAQAEVELRQVRAVVPMLQARRRLHLALMALDERNFGTARDYLAAAGADLAAVPSPPAGADAAVLARLAQDLQAARLIATEDLSQQRGRVMEWVRQLDAQFPAETATAAQAAESGAAGTDAATSPASGPASLPAAPVSPAPPSGTQ